MQQAPKIESIEKPLYINELFHQLISNPESFKQFLNSFPGVVYSVKIVKPEGKIDYMTPNIEQLTGYDSSMFLSGEVSFKDIIEYEELMSLIEYFREVEKKGDLFSCHYTITHKNGHTKKIHSQGHIIRDKKGKPIRVHGTMLDVSEKISLETELKRVISINENFFNSSPNLIFAKNKKGIYRMANNAMSEFMRLPLDQIIGKTDFDLFDDKSEAQKYFEQDQHVLETGEVWEGKPVHFTSKGSKGWFKTIKSPLKNKDGSVEGVLAIVCNVTELVESQQVIKEQKNLLKTVFNTGTDLIAVLKPVENDYLYFTCNRPYVDFLRSFGASLTEQDIKGKFLLEHSQQVGLFNKEQAKDARNKLDLVLSSKKPHSFTIISKISGTNNNIYIDVELSPILNENGEVKFIVYRGHDFSELMQYNKQLQESEELFQSINRNIQDGIYRSTVNKGLRYANNAMCKMFGYSYKELEKIKPTSLYNFPKERENIIQELLAHGHFKDRELLFKRKDGSTFWGLLSCSMTLEPDGTKVIDGIVVDVTEERETRENLRKTNAKLRKINSELDHLVYRTSHDLRSPIASVMGLLELLKLEGIEGESKQYVELMEDQLFKLDKVILDIINIRKIAKTGLQRQQIDFNLILENLLDSIKYLENFDRLKKRIEIEEETPLYQDENNLKILLNNLISNSVKYIDTKKKKNFLDIRIHVNSKYCNIVVEDNGIGINQDRIPLVFDMFYRATDKNQGTGLGLFIVKEAVDKLKGSISVESDEGSYTRFTVKIPNRINE